MLNAQLAPTVLALEQKNNLSVLLNGVVYFFSFLYSDIGGELGNDFSRIEDVIAKHMNKRKHQSVLRGLLGFQHSTKFLSLYRQGLDLLHEIHQGHSFFVPREMIARFCSS